ncbi:nitroreductase [Actinobacillus lignieresii]|nr:hypothetical protein [Actinobacillus lignieresii]VEB26751.1 nitroreductase [Actinobacillus lignieresii]
MLDFSTTTQTRKSIREYLPEPLTKEEMNAVLKDALAILPLILFLTNTH